jgi:hypothetical protein
MFYDLAGYPVSVADEDTHLAWNEIVEAVLAHDATAADRIYKTLVADPNFALAHAVNGLMILALARSDLVPAAATCLDKARQAKLNRAITSREDMFLQALEQWLLEAPRKSAIVLERILADYPLDALAIKLAHTLRFMLGDQAQMLSVLQRVAPAFGQYHPFAGFINGCLAFALEERGLYSDAEYTGRLAVSLSPRDVWGRHAVAHVLEMSGRADEGMTWLADDRQWIHANNFKFHLTWHHALFKMELGELAEVTELYDQRMVAECTDDYRDIASCASLLARLEYAGVDVGRRWEGLADQAERRAEDGRLVFADIHYILALLGADRVESAEAIARTLVDDSSAHASDERRIAARGGGIAACGLLAFYDGDYAEAAKLFSVASSTLIEIGGSNAQRDLFEQVYIESLVRSGNEEQAAVLLKRRLVDRLGSNRFAAERLGRLGRTPSSRLGALATLSALCRTDHPSNKL